VTVSARGARVMGISIETEGSRVAEVTRRPRRGEA
jgi:hypothetical protein